MTMRFSRDTESEFQERSTNQAPLAADLESQAIPDVPAAGPLTGMATDLSVYVPEYYEENYPYPLIVWVQPGNAPAHELGQIMPVISERNYFGMSLCAEASESNEESTEADYNSLDSVDLEEKLYAQIRQLRREYHIHTERIFLAGLDRGATCALELGLARPEWFAGIACLAGHFPGSPRPLARFRDLRGKRVLVGVGVTDRKVTLAETLRTARLLHAAGMKVCTRFYDTGHQITRKMLTDVDRWVMQEIHHPQPVS